jgi:hypothetical protein
MRCSSVAVVGYLPKNVPPVLVSGHFDKRDAQIDSRWGQRELVTRGDRKIS